MRNKFLIIIGSLVLFSVLFAGCIKSEVDDYEYSIDTSIRAFGIDSIKGKYYPFSIDLLNNSIYNRDSLPYLSDTLLKSFKIDTFNVRGYITSGDSVLDIPGNYPLINAVNGADGIMFTVYSIDGHFSRNYRLDIRVHLQDPDSLVWSQVNNLPTELAGVSLGQQFRMMSLNVSNQPMIFDGANKKVFTYFGEDTYTFMEEDRWKSAAIEGLPDNLRWDTMVKYKNVLYINSTDGDVYAGNGLTWQKLEALSGNVKYLLAGMSDRLLAVETIDGTDYFCYSTNGLNWTKGQAVPANFPRRNIHSIVLTTPTGVEKATITGDVDGESDEVVPWFTFEGDNWAALDTEDMACPAMGNPIIFNYNNMFYLFGSGFDAMYESPSTLTWNKKTSKMLFPNSLKGAETYSSFVDDDHFIWLLVSTSTGNQLWRGRLNKYGFKRQ